MIDANPPALQQMIDVFERGRRPGARRRARAAATTSARYGIIDARAKCGPGVYRIRDLVEKPPRDEAPSDLAIIGRYILTPDIFPALEATAKRPHRRDPADQRPARLLKTAADLRLRIDGVRHDTGNKLGFLKAVVYFALRRPDLAEPFREYLQTIDLDKPAAEPLSARSSCRLVPTTVVASACRRRCRLRLDVSSRRWPMSRTARRRLAGSVLPASVEDFLRVVGDVEARSLELNRGRREQLADRPLPHFGQTSSGGSGIFWIARTAAAGFALVFVQGASV